MIRAPSFPNPVSSSPEVVMVPAASPEVALLPEAAPEEVQHDGFFPTCPVDAGGPRPEALVAQISPKVVLVAATASIVARLDGYFPARPENADGFLLPQSSPVALGLACPSPLADDLIQQIMGSPVGLASPISS
ncbi:hypothetical protein SLA2020_417500 [Shorea laevis]